MLAGGHQPGNHLHGLAHRFARACSQGLRIRATPEAAAAGSAEATEAPAAAIVADELQRLLEADCIAGLLDGVGRQ